MRRRLAGPASLIVLSLIAAGCGADGGSAGSGGTFTFVAYGGTTQENVVNVFVEPFVEEKGLTLVEDNTDVAKLYSQVDAAAVSWDIVSLEAWYSNAACADGKATPIDTTVVDTSVLPDNHVGECWVAPWSMSFVLAYRGDLPRKPTSWADFYDTENFPGKRGMWSFYQGGQLESALLADGVAPEDVFPIDIERAIAKIATIKDDIIFSDSLQEMVQQLVSGETSMAILLSGRVAAQIKRGADLGIVWKNQIMQPDSYMVPKGAPQTEASMQLLNSMLDADKLVEFAKVQFYGPAVKEAQDMLASDPDCELINTCGDKVDYAVHESTEFWMEKEADVSAAWDRLLGR